MDSVMKQQIVISGVGGQGVLFVTGLLANAAMNNGNHVLTSETHGMAQRGGIVVSHLKVGPFTSPMIRPGSADGLIALKGETVCQFSGFLKDGAWMAVNERAAADDCSGFDRLSLDADSLAAAAGNPKAVNLVMLGLALAMMEKTAPGPMICSLADIRAGIENRFAGKDEIRDASLKALASGYAHPAANA